MKKVLVVMMFLLVNLYADEICKDVNNAKQLALFQSVNDKAVIVPINFYTCIDDKYKYYLSFKDVLNYVKVALDTDEYNELLQKLQKAKKWDVKAKKIKAPEFKKLLFENSKDNRGEYSNTNILEIYFYSTDKGQNNYLIINVVSFENQFYKIITLMPIKDKMLDNFIYNIKEEIKIQKELAKKKDVINEFN